MRSTLADIANEAGVSPATVDRVLNKRSNVKPRTRDMVLDVARRLGYLAGEGPPQRSPPLSDRVHLSFVLPIGTNSFIETLRQQIIDLAMNRPDLSVEIITLAEFRPEILAGALYDLIGKTRGIGVISLDHPIVREAIRTVNAAGIKVLTLASDISDVPRIAYVGIDNRAAGRLAGYLLGRLLPKRGRATIALFAGSLSYRGHEEREMGFRHILSEEFPEIEIVEMLEMQDDREMAYSKASALLQRHPNLSGIYNIGAGNAGIARALREAGRQREVVFIGHEATGVTREALLDGTIDAVIDQNPRVEAREALNILSSSIRGHEYVRHQPRLQVIFKENIPEI
jgi:LacI family transcriptional regulator